MSSKVYQDGTIREADTSEEALIKMGGGVYRPMGIC